MKSKISHPKSILILPEINEFINSLDINHVISKEVRENMAFSLTRFLEHSIAKYIKGQEEHGGDIRDRDLAFEIEQEFYDTFWYNEAMHNWPAGPGELK